MRDRRDSWLQQKARRAWRVPGMGRRSQPGSPSLSQTMGHPVPKTVSLSVRKKSTGLLSTPLKPPTSFFCFFFLKEGRKQLHRKFPIHPPMTWLNKTVLPPQGILTLLGCSEPTPKADAFSWRDAILGQEGWSSERRSSLQTALGKPGLGTKAAETAKHQNICRKWLQSLPSPLAHSHPPHPPKGVLTHDYRWSPEDLVTHQTHTWFQWALDHYMVGEQGRQMKRL